MFSISDLGLDYFMTKKIQKKYIDIAYNESESIENRIYSLLTFNPGFMKDVETEQQKHLENSKERTKSLIKEKVEDNKKIEFVTLYFNAKSTNTNITNHMIYPDVSDFLTLLHLTRVFKFINDIYKPGATIYIGSECNYFYKLALTDLKATTNMTSILLKFKRIAEDMNDSDPYVFLWDVYEELAPINKDFFMLIEKAKLNALKQEGFMEELIKGADYYLEFVIDTTKFPSIEAARNFCIFHTLEAAGYNEAVRKVNNTPNGLFENYDKKIFINPRFFADSHSGNEHRVEIFIPLLPGAFTFSFNALSLKSRNGKWTQINYKEVKEKQYEGFFVLDLSYPFFYIEREGEGNL